MNHADSFVEGIIVIAQQDSAETPIPRVSDDEFATYSDFYGFPSMPISVYHTGERWPRPTGPEAYRVPKEARPICNHPIAAVWHELGRRIYEYFDSVDIKWTTIDPVRFANDGKEVGPLFLWVGVIPRTLFRGHAMDAAVECKKILAESQITDVEIAFRESVFTRSVGPQLLNYPSFFDSTADIRRPFTPALGLSIAAQATPHFEGTGGVYLCEGDESERVFLLTARHVVLPPSAGSNELYVHKNNGYPRREVVLFGSKSYQDALDSITKKKAGQVIRVDYYKRALEGLGVAVEGGDEEKAEERKYFEHQLKKAENSISAIDKFHSEITQHWSAMNQRVLGHIVHSPPISVGNTGSKPFTEDWALIEIHKEKINWKKFKGNVIDLGTKNSPDVFIPKMFPHPAAGTSLKYPPGRLLQLQGIVTEDELRHPTALDANGEECIIVLKSGNATGVTMGRTSGIKSFVREYDGHDIRSTSMEIAIYSYSDTFKDGAFSAPGDSGSIIADGDGRIIGLLTGGTGKADDIDVTYASPYYWINERFKEAFPNAHLYPVKA